MKDLNNQDYLRDVNATIGGVEKELREGINFLNSVENGILSIFGGASVEEGSEYYNHCKEVARRVGEKGYTIMSGGGPGIMHAANSGAMEAGARSVGLKAHLLEKEQTSEGVFTDVVEFDYIFVRKFILAIKSNALVFYPGGYGTLDELFEYLTLMQVEICEKVPVVLVGREHWQGLYDWLIEKPGKKQLLHGDENLSLIHLVNSVEEVVDLVTS